MEIKKITFNETPSGNAPVTLSSLVKDLPVGSLDSLSLEIALEPGVFLELVNDLFDGAARPELVEGSQRAGVSQHLTFLLHGNSSLMYRHIVTSGLPDTFSCKQDLAVILLGEKARASIIMRYALKDQQQFVISTRQEHRAGNTHSNLSLRTALFDDAHLTNKSMIFVPEHCLSVLAHQENKNLLMSPQASVLSKPDIDIRSHQIKCTHGATASRICPEALWFLMSRGMLEAPARDLLVTGFLGL